MVGRLKHNSLIWIISDIYLKGICRTKSFMHEKIVPSKFIFNFCMKMKTLPNNFHGWKNHPRDKFFIFMHRNITFSCMILAFSRIESSCNVFVCMKLFDRMLNSTKITYTFLTIPLWYEDIDRRVRSCVVVYAPDYRGNINNETCNPYAPGC